ncbi:MAG: hypothetical protein WKG07_35945 [Hymenobacter sp.]
MQTVVSLDAIILAFTVSALIGLFFGVYPAVKRLPPQPHRVRCATSNALRVMYEQLSTPTATSTPRSPSRALRHE